MEADGLGKKIRICTAIEPEVRFLFLPPLVSPYLIVWNLEVGPSRGHKMLLEKLASSGWSDWKEDS